MRWLALVLVLTSTIAFAQRRVPLRKGLVPAGKSWHCARDLNTDGYVTTCHREAAQCTSFVIAADKRAKYSACVEQPSAVCLTYKERARFVWTCHESTKSCESYRGWVRDNVEDAEGISDCWSVK